MSYPLARPEKLLFPGIAALLLTLPARALVPVQDYLYFTFPGTPNLPKNTLYRKQDPAMTYTYSGIVRHEKNGDIVITVPAQAFGRCKIRFLDEKEELLFEIRQIRDSLLIVEKYNFGHAGLFRYELYLDNCLAEKSSFRIDP